MNDNTDIDDASASFRKAFELDELGEYAKALSIRKALEKNEPKHKWLLVSLGQSYENLKKFDKAEEYYKKATALYPKSKTASLHLFHFYWDEDEILEDDRKDEAFDEMRRFQSISHCEDYVEIVREINEKYELDEAKRSN